MTKYPEHASVTTEPGAAHLILTSADHDLLSLSNSIARARMAAANAANKNVPWAQGVGLAAVIIGALATLFVTLQGKMKPFDLPEDKKKDLDLGPLNSRVVHVLSGPGAGFRWVAFLAITLSITATSLTGLKQVYDPTRTLTQNTRTLLDLRQLHQDIILGIRCEGPQGARTVAFDQRSREWAASVHRLRAAIIPDYGAYANLDVGGSSSQRNDPGNGPPAPGAVTPVVEKAPSGDSARPASGADGTAEPRLAN